MSKFRYFMRWCGLVVALFSVFVKAGAIQAAPYVSAPAYCLIEAESGQVILSAQAGQQRPAASTTKMLTAALALEYTELTDVADISAHADHTPEYTAGLKQGERISVEDLIKVALIRSANDAAVVLAEYVAGDERFFSHMMSQKAFAIGAMNTHFVNASGLPDNAHYSTAYDLAVIARYVMLNPSISEIVGARQTEYNHPDYAEPLTISNTNRLLYMMPEANGVKTGTTNAAGNCLVSSAVKNNRHLIASVLKSGDRYGDSLRILEYGFNNTNKVKVADSNIPWQEITVYNGDREKIPVYPEHDVNLNLGEKDYTRVEKKINMKYYLEAPVAKGTDVGYMEIYVDGFLADRVALVTKETVSRDRDIFRKLSQWLAAGG